MKKIFFIGLVLTAILSAFIGCSSQKTDESDHKAQAQKKQAAVEKKTIDPLLTKDGLEKKLAGFGITAYPEADFEKIKYNDDGYTISYKVPDISQQSKDDVDKHYKKIYKKLIDDGWKKFDELHAIFSKHKQMIRFSHLYKPELKMHKLYVSYGLIE
jgi:hypothetical protein